MRIFPFLLATLSKVAFFSVQRLGSVSEQLALLRDHKGKFIVEKPLKEKKFSEYLNISELTKEIKNELEGNYIDYSKQFEGEPLGFTYYLGAELLFSNSVEVLQKIYHKEREDIGNLYYSLVIKFNEDKYYYWKW